MNGRTMGQAVAGGDRLNEGRSGLHGPVGREPGQVLPRLFRPFLLCLFLMVAALPFGSGALACGIDGIPSMAMNGRLVTINHGPATKENLSYWAAFLLGTAKTGTTLRFAENEGELHRSLSAPAFATPFQWSFGDGATARGMAVTHRYSQSGWYKVNVSYYYTPQARWVTFDSAQLQIPGSSQDGGIAAPLIWAIAGGLLGTAALILAIMPWRRGRPKVGAVRRA